MIQISIGRLFLVCLFCTLFNDELKSHEDNSNNVHPKVIFGLTIQDQMDLEKESM